MVSTTTKTEDDSAVQPPVSLLAAGLVAVLISLALLAVGTLAAHIAGYVLGSFVPILAVGLFRARDRIRRISPYYQPRAILDQLVPLVLVAGLLATVLHTWFIATELAS